MGLSIDPGGCCSQHTAGDPPECVPGGCGLMTVIQYILLNDQKGLLEQKVKLCGWSRGSDGLS